MILGHSDFKKPPLEHPELGKFAIQGEGFTIGGGNFNGDIVSTSFLGSHEGFTLFNLYSETQQVMSIYTVYKR